MKKIKVVWICSFSNSEVRKHYTLKVPSLVQLIHRFVRKANFKAFDIAQWNTFAINEFEKFEDVELYVVSPVYFLSNKEERFEINGVKYYFFRDENSSSLKQIYFRLYNQYYSKFKKNRKRISDVISEIKPDIVHVIGAENPFYSLAALDIPKSVLSIVQLQTLLNQALDNKTIYGSKLLKRKADIEKQIINHVDYVGTSIPNFQNYIKDFINKKCQFLDISLAVTEPIDMRNYDKKYDFVYFSFDISKAFDQVLEAFAVAITKNANLTMNVVGGYSSQYKIQIDKRIKDLGLTDNINFEGKQDTHDDVLKKIRECKYALLPQAGDKVSSTIREAMANGLPVVSTITEEGTPILNIKRECILLSEKNDYETMANNMLKLVSNPKFAEVIRENAYITASERSSNKEIMLKWLDTYKLILQNSKI